MLGFLTLTLSYRDYNNSVIPYIITAHSKGCRLRHYSLRPKKGRHRLPNPPEYLGNRVKDNPARRTVNSLSVQRNTPHLCSELHSRSETCHRTVRQYNVLLLEEISQIRGRYVLILVMSIV